MSLAIWASSPELLCRTDWKQVSGGSPGLSSQPDPTRHYNIMVITLYCRRFFLYLSWKGSIHHLLNGYRALKCLINKVDALIECKSPLVSCTFWSYYSNETTSQFSRHGELANACVLCVRALAGSTWCHFLVKWCKGRRCIGKALLHKGLPSPVMSHLLLRSHQTPTEAAMETVAGVPADRLGEGVGSRCKWGRHVATPRGTRTMWGASRTSE